MVSRCAAGVTCEVYSIGQSYEGRDILVFRVRIHQTDLLSDMFNSDIYVYIY